MSEPQKTQCRVIRGGAAFKGKQELIYEVGISAESAGAQHIHMQIVTIPPGARAKAHKHENHETAIYGLRGESHVWHGEKLEHHSVVKAGDFFYIPADIPHLPYNPSETEEVVALISRTDANEQESVSLMPELDGLHTYPRSRPYVDRQEARSSVLAGDAPPASAGEAYQVATISSLLAGGYDGDTTIDEMLRHGDFGLGTFNGVDGEMMVLDGRVYRGTTDSRAHLVARSERTPFAVVVDFQPQTSMPVAAGQSLEQLQAALDALPYSASLVLAVRIDGQFQSIQVRSEPKQTPPYRPLAEVIKEKQVVNTLNEVDGTLIGFRFPAATSSVNVAGWHFHFLTSGEPRGGHVFTLTTGMGRALIQEISDLRIRLPAQAPDSSAGAEAVNAVEQSP
jgi:acetolactate decarboxylase